MKRRLLIVTGILLTLISANLIFTKRISNWFLNSKIESAHFIINSKQSDSSLAKKLQTVFEKDYQRISIHLGSGLKNKIVVHLFTSNQLFNMSFGNPFPLPRRADNYGGQHIENDSYILIPETWIAQPDSVFPPERTRTTSAHEMAHAFVYLINPEVKGWVTEGVAKFEETAVFNDQIRDAGFKSLIGKRVTEGKIPRFDELFSGTKIISDDIVLDYTFSGTFIDFASVKYGFPSVISFIKSNDFNTSFGKSEDEIRQEWIQYLNEKYSG
jgi:hypothetical protein